MSHYNVGHLNRLNNVLLCINFLHLTVSMMHSPDKILKMKATFTRLMVKLMSHHDVGHLHSLKDVLLSINFPHITGSVI